MASDSIHPLVDHLFRRESGKLVSVLTKIFGPTYLELAEDVVQDTLIKALDHWKFHGIPDNPTAWLFTAARNKALDVIRRERYKKEFASHLNTLLQSEYSAGATIVQLVNENEIQDEQLRMMFVCCHPVVAEEGQIAMILKTLCGFSVAEIAKAFVTSEETITKRLYRAREQFRQEKVRFELPPPHLLHERLDAVLTAIYLLFNEGYNSSHHDMVIREDLVEESLRLGNLLASHPATQLPNTFALLALLCFHAARLYGRVGPENQLLTLREQDRSKWNRRLIEQGRQFQVRAAGADTLSHYHLEAAIAFEHCQSADFESTNWSRILELYDLLYQLKPTAMVGLNRAVVICELKGPRAGLDSLDQVPDLAAIEKYYLLHAVRADMLARLGDIAAARTYLDRAIALTESQPEKDLMNRKLKKLTE